MYLQISRFYFNKRIGWISRVYSFSPQHTSWPTATVKSTSQPFQAVHPSRVRSKVPSSQNWSTVSIIHCYHSSTVHFVYPTIFMTLHPKQVEWKCTGTLQWLRSRWTFCIWFLLYNSLTSGGSWWTSTKQFSRN